MPEELTPLEARVLQLEARVADLESRLSPPAAGKQTQPIPIPETRAPARAPAPARTNWFDQGEAWMGKAGIGLLVVGMVLLFQYAVNRGWLTPSMRIGIGLLIGGGLLFGGARHFLQRRLYRQILMGGGIVILLITGLAASELYHLISGSTALGFFLVIAVIALTIASKQEEPVIASLGSTGALLTPAFLLQHSVPGGTYWLYSAVLIAWTGGLATMKQWNRTFVIGALAAVVSMTRDIPANAFDARNAAVLAIIACWIVYAALPLLRSRILAERKPQPFARDLLLIAPTLITLALAMIAQEVVFEGNHRMFELSAGMDAAGYLIIALMLRPHRTTDPASQALSFRGLPILVDAFSAAMVACLFSLALAAAAAFDETGVVLALGAIAFAGIWFSRNLGVTLLEVAAHVLFGIVALMLAGSVEVLAREGAFDNRAVAFIMVTALAALASRILEREDDRTIYLVGVYLAAHILMATELTDVPGAPWLASTAYAVTGATLLYYGVTHRRLAVQRAGMVSLALLLGRLFMYDLANVDVGVRIVLFLVFGFAFLGLSYLVRSSHLTE